MTDLGLSKPPLFRTTNAFSRTVSLRKCRVLRVHRAIHHHRHRVHYSGGVGEPQPCALAGMGHRAAIAASGGHSCVFLLRQELEECDDDFAQQSYEAAWASIAQHTRILQFQPFGIEPANHQPGQFHR